LGGKKETNWKRRRRRRRREKEQLVVVEFNTRHVATCRRGI